MDEGVNGLMNECMSGHLNHEIVNPKIDSIKIHLKLNYNISMGYYCIVLRCVCVCVCVCVCRGLFGNPTTFAGPSFDDQ